MCERPERDIDGLTAVFLRWGGTNATFVLGRFACAAFVFGNLKVALLTKIGVETSFGMPRFGGIINIYAAVREDDA
jgi:hypothetical protein